MWVPKRGPVPAVGQRRSPEINGIQGDSWGRAGGRWVQVEKCQVEAVAASKAWRTSRIFGRQYFRKAEAESGELRSGGGRELLVRGEAETRARVLTSFSRRVTDYSGSIWGTVQTRFRAQTRTSVVQAGRWWPGPKRGCGVEEPERHRTRLGETEEVPARTGCGLQERVKSQGGHRDPPSTRAGHSRILRRLNNWLTFSSDVTIAWSYWCIPPRGHFIFFCPNHEANLGAGLWLPQPSLLSSHGEEFTAAPPSTILSPAFLPLSVSSVTSAAAI